MKSGLAQKLGLMAGPLLALSALLVLPVSDADLPGGAGTLGPEGRATLAVTLWMATWWMTEAIPLYATALLPIAVLPMLGVGDIVAVTAPYAHPLIFLFMGGFMLAQSMSRWRLDERISLLALQLSGPEPPAIVATFMGVTALLSMWVSNTATAVMMLPIALGVVDLVRSDTAPAAPGSAEAAQWVPDVEPRKRFATCLLLGIAYAASIGGVGTLVGTPPNRFLASYAEANLGIEIGFARWMAVGVPLVLVFLPICYLLLTRVLFPIAGVSLPGGRSHIRERLVALGPVQRGERVTFVVFSLTALAWVSRPLLARLELAGSRPLAGLTDPGIAMAAALALFVIPVDWAERRFTLDWASAAKLPWGLLILFGGGLSLASAIQSHGVGEFLGHQFEHRKLRFRTRQDIQ
jgi:sodium-dependent dicarboxylate transporter 2/3/5